MNRLAFYDFDGTLCAGNVVQRYAFFALNYPSRVQAMAKYARLLASVPVLVGLDFYSRRLFNEVFYRKYRGMEEQWLRSLEGPLFERVILPRLYSGAQALVERDRAEGFRAVLVTGELDFALSPVVRYFGFDLLLSN